jgi:hypothetical protein
MLILFDHGTPAPLRLFLKDHTVKKTKDLGWDTLSNGEVILPLTLKLHDVLQHAELVRLVQQPV